MFAVEFVESLGISRSGSVVPTGACQLSHALSEISRPPVPWNGTVLGFFGATEGSACAKGIKTVMLNRKVVAAKAQFFIFAINLVYEPNFLT